MGRVLTNNTALQYAIETTELSGGVIGVLPGELGQSGTPEWRLTEPNSYGAIGAEITTVARNPISPNRQRRKGTITDLDSASEFEADLTISHMMDFAEGFVFSAFNGAEDYIPTAVDADSYTVGAGSVLVTGTLVFGRGFGTTANNGLKTVGVGSTTTDIVVINTLTVEGVAPTNATVEVAGFRTAAGDLAVSDVTGNLVTITSIAGIFDDPGLNLIPGMAIFFGGAASLNRFTDTNNAKYCRIVSVAAAGASIVIDKTGTQWVTEVAAAQEVDFYIGKFLRNVSTSDAEFLERSFQFEVTYPNLDTGGADKYEYSKGNYCNTIAFNLPLSDKSTFSPSFIGLDTDTPTVTRKPNASTALAPTMSSAFNTTQDLARLRIAEIDETGLTTDFKSLTLTLSNNVSPEKVLANLGARFMNFGNFEVSLEAQALFTDSRVTDAIRNNDTLSADFVLKNDDGAILVDIPSMTLGGGGKDFPTNETVLINLTGDAFADSTLNTSIGISVFSYIPEFV